MNKSQQHTSDRKMGGAGTSIYENRPLLLCKPSLTHGLRKASGHLYSRPKSRGWKSVELCIDLRVPKPRKPERIECYCLPSCFIKQQIAMSPSEIHGHEYNDGVFSKKGQMSA